MDHSAIEEQIRTGTKKGGKSYSFNDGHNPTKPLGFNFTESHEGLTLTMVFYTQACRWSRCIACALPSTMSFNAVPFHMVMNQMDVLFDDPEVSSRRKEIRKVIVSNNGSVLDSRTFSTTALMYLIAKLNLNFPYLDVLSLETRVEHADLEELEFLSMALSEGQTKTRIELAVGFEVFDEHIRNEVFDKGLTFDMFEKFVRTVTPYGYKLKTYFMQKPVPDMDDEEAVADITNAIDYLHDMAVSYKAGINMHLNPTYAAKGTILAAALKDRMFTPPQLTDVACAALHAKGKNITLQIGLSDDGVADPGGSFIREGDEETLELLRLFNRTQDFSYLEQAAGL